MSREAGRSDSAVSESFLGTLKQKLIYYGTHATREEVKQEIFEYAGAFYNGQRRPSVLGTMSPLAFAVAFS